MRWKVRFQTLLDQPFRGREKVRQYFFIPYYGSKRKWNWKGENFPSLFIAQVTVEAQYTLHGSKRTWTPCEGESSSGRWWKGWSMNFAESFGESLLEEKAERLLSHNTSYLEHSEKILALHLQMPRIAKCSLKPFLARKLSTTRR